MIILFTWRVCNNKPNPKSSTPQLLLTTVSSRTSPLLFNAEIKFSGIPHNPNPPTSLQLKKNYKTLISKNN